MLSTLLDPYGQPLRRPGRPRNDPQADRTREFTVGGSSSTLGNFSNTLGYEKLLGNVDDMDLRLGWHAKEEMDRDPVCNANLSTLALGATARPVEVEPASKALYISEDDEKMADEIAGFIRRCLIYLKNSQRDMNLTAYQLGRAAMKIGHSKAEIVMRRMAIGPDAGKYVPDRVKSKNRYNSAFVIDRQGNIAKIAAFTGVYSDYANPYKNPAMGLNGVLPYSTLGSNWSLLGRDKFLVMTCRPNDDDTPLGSSLYRPVYTAYRMKRDVWAMYLKSLDNTAIPHKVGELPEHGYDGPTQPLDEDGVPDQTADAVPMAEAMYQSIEQGAQGGTTIIPHGAKVYQLFSAQSGDPFMVAQSVFDSQITMGILHQALATGTAKHMARSAGEVHQDILDLAMRNVRRMICDAISRDCFAVWVRMNYPERYWHLVPSCSFGEVELNDFAAWAEAFSKLLNAGLILPSQFPHIWAVLGLPQGDLKEFWKMLEIDAKLAEQILEPDPVTGISQGKQYAKQETGKRESRTAATRRVGRQGAALSG